MIELGYGHACEFVGPEDEPHGIIERHRDADGRPCEVYVPFTDWQVIALDPLTLLPSIICPPEDGGCGAHGYIRHGMWIH